MVYRSKVSQVCWPVHSEIVAYTLQFLVIIIKEHIIDIYRSLKKQLTLSCCSSEYSHKMIILTLYYIGGYPEIMVRICAGLSLMSNWKFQSFSVRNLSQFETFPKKCFMYYYSFWNDSPYYVSLFNSSKKYMVL